MGRTPVREDPNLYLSQLTSLRGIACLVVLVGHVLQVLHYDFAHSSAPDDWRRALLTYPFNAEGAVLIFFVLSGCVLALSLRRLERPELRPILSFYVKRVFRIYPLLCFSVLCAVISVIMARPLVARHAFVDWLARNLMTTINVPHAVLSLTGLYTRFNGPMWSLRVELIYSLLFPAIFLLVRNSRTRWITVVALFLLAGVPLPSQTGSAFGFSFALGATIPFLRPTARHLGRIALPLAILALFYDRWALAPLGVPRRGFDVVETLASFVVWTVYAAGPRFSLLTRRPLVWLGELSYSVYLLHLPIMLILFSLATAAFSLQAVLGAPVLTPVLLSLATAAVTLPLSAATYHFLELPLHNLGRSIGKQVAGPQRPRAGAGLPHLQAPRET